MEKIEDYTTKRTSNILLKKGYEYLEQLVSLFPKDYKDCSYCLTEITERYGAYKGILKSVKMDSRKGSPIVKAVILTDSGTIVHISWFNQYWKFNELTRSCKTGDKILFAGMIRYLPQYHGFFMTNPDIFQPYDKALLKVYPVYSKISGITEKTLCTLIRKALQKADIYDVPELPETDMTLKEAVMELHIPTSTEQIKKAKETIHLYSILYFLQKLRQNDLTFSKNTKYQIHSLVHTADLIQSLPYELTPDQKKITSEIIKKIKDGHQVHALVEGDVGCGKTMIAFIMMFAMADNGFQSLLFAPTTVLAEQHYKELSGYAETYGYKTAYLYSGMKKKEKKAVLEKIKNGEVHMIVGTHSVLQSDVEFYDLGLAVIDEEHKFGVIQRDSIIEKSKNGIHIINMSATPIPRSLTNVIVTDSIDIYRVMTMPKGRKQVKTTVYNDKDGIHRFEYFEIQKGHQIYVVCPLVSESEYMDGVLSAETCYQEYCQVFQPFNIRVAMLNGQMKKEEIKKTIAEYAAGKIHILIATTVIEVGVNVPNASTIVVNNAERFGLAGLHQLRGRVGRGNEQGYCILNSAEKNNERLQALCQYSNGFDIAEADLKLRGPGNIIGTEQSGDDYFIRLIMMYPEFYQKYKKKDMCMEDGFAQEYEKFFVLTSAFRKKMLDTL